MALTDQLLTVKQVAEMLQIDPETVRVYARKGILPYIKLGNQIRFRPSTLQEFLSASEVKPDNLTAGAKDIT